MITLLYSTNEPYILLHHIPCLNFCSNYKKVYFAYNLLMPSLNFNIIFNIIFIFNMNFDILYHVFILFSLLSQMQLFFSMGRKCKVRQKIETCVLTIILTLALNLSRLGLEMCKRVEDGCRKEAINSIIFENNNKIPREGFHVTDNEQGIPIFGEERLSDERNKFEKKDLY